MLVRLDSELSCPYFAEVEKLAELVAKFGQLTIIMLCKIHVDIS
jgi:hypothetical protein